MTFYLGTHIPSWLEKCETSLFISYSRLKNRVTISKPTVKSWILDSGAFSELSINGKWTISAQKYADDTRFIRDITPRMSHAVIQDWMCEPFILDKTGLSVLEHQKRTVDSFLKLTTLAPDISWMPVLQGYTIDEYLECIDLYTLNEIDLTKYLVGVGSVCKRQHTLEIGSIAKCLKEQHGLRTHFFGVKQAGIYHYGAYMASADSMAWSYNARREDRMEGCIHSGNCANCIRYAMNWRNKLKMLAIPSV
jgi:hypothetical protein